MHDAGAFLCLKYYNRNVNYIKNAPQETMVSAGYYAIDLSDYGVASQNDNVFTFTYTVKTICRSYGIDYTQLTADDFVFGYNYIPTISRFWGIANPSVYVNGPHPSPSYDATTGKFTIANVSMPMTVNSSDGVYTSYGVFTAETIFCMLVPKSVVVD